MNYIISLINLKSKFLVFCLVVCQSLFSGNYIGFYTGVVGTSYGYHQRFQLSPDFVYQYNRYSTTLRPLSKSTMSYELAVKHEFKKSRVSLDFTLNYRYVNLYLAVNNFQKNGLIGYSYKFRWLTENIFLNYRIWKNEVSEIDLACGIGLVKNINFNKSLQSVRKYWNPPSGLTIEEDGKKANMTFEEGYPVSPVLNFGCKLHRNISKEIKLFAGFNWQLVGYTYRFKMTWPDQNTNVISGDLYSRNKSLLFGCQFKL